MSDLTSQRSGKLNKENKSCGCDMQADLIRYGKDITGMRFGRLTAVRPTMDRKNQSIVWECLCDCGNTVFESMVALGRGRTLSCGCIQKEQEQQRIDALTKKNAGKRFGYLTILHAVEKKDSRDQYVCRCDCGNLTVTSMHTLQTGLVKSCGCLFKEVGRRRIHDLTEQRFGMLTVVRQTDERKRRAVVWECRCDCGTTTFIVGSKLLSGNTKSCGCVRKSRRQK